MKRLSGTSALAGKTFRFRGDRSPFATTKEAREIVDLVTLILNRAIPGAGNPVPAAIMLETLGGGRSGAYVFKATPLAADQHTRNGVPVVVKIAPLDAGTSEQANYEQFVRPLLTVAHRPVLYAFATTDDRAALCYSLVGNTETPETLTDRLAMQDLAALDVVLSSLVEALHQCWYSTSQTAPEIGLGQYYLARYFENSGSVAAAETLLSGHTARYFHARPCAEGYRIGATTFPSIGAALFGNPDARAYTSCILHGDLNSDNIILDRDRSLAAVVDFQRTGRGHVFQDLVALEMSVRINDPSPASWDQIFEIERRIARGEPGMGSHPYAVAICNIRDTARRLFGIDEVNATYAFARACIGLRLMRATDLSDTASARITASILWAAKTLTEN